MDREKVVSTFEKIISVCKEDGCDFVDLTFEDAEHILTLLKEQETTTFKPHYIDKYSKHFICGLECGSCHKEISSTYHYCPYCGKAVKWK